VGVIEHRLIILCGRERERERKSVCVKQVKVCKAIPGKGVTTQHRLMIMELWRSGKTVCKNKKNTGRESSIRKLKLVVAKETEFLKKVKERTV